MRIFAPFACIFAAQTLMPVTALADISLGHIDVGALPTASAFDPASGRLYVANTADGTLSIIDTSTFATSELGVGSEPVALAVDSEHERVYVANRGDDTVSVIEHGEIVDTIAVGAQPTAVAADPLADRAYVANMGGGSVTVIDGTTHETTTILTGAGPVAVTADPVHGRAYVANRDDNSFSVIDGGTLQAHTIPIPRQPSRDRRQPGKPQRLCREQRRRPSRHLSRRWHQRGALRSCRARARCGDGQHAHR